MKDGFKDKSDKTRKRSLQMIRNLGEFVYNHSRESLEVIQ